jgi:hypothetical protein
MAIFVCKKLCLSALLLHHNCCTWWFNWSQEHWSHQVLERSTIG